MSPIQPKHLVDLNAIAGHSIPPLLSRFGAWLSSQEYGSLGWFLKRKPLKAAVHVVLFQERVDFTSNLLIGLSARVIAAQDTCVACIFLMQTAVVLPIHSYNNPLLVRRPFKYQVIRRGIS
jgi:hypothetical protein